MIFILKQAFIASVLFCGYSFFMYLGIYIVYEIILMVKNFINGKGKYSVKD